MKSVVITIATIAALAVLGGWYLDSKGDTAFSFTDLKIENTGSKGPHLDNYGEAPEFAGIENWLNSDPLTMEQLRGKVVLIDFWTYSCINCIRTFPYVKGWYEKYKDQGFVVVGVHTPEFAFEKDKSNVQTAIKRHGLEYPVAQDNNFDTWRAYSNRYWPAHYLIDQSGTIVYYHFGEGKYSETEQAIQKLLGVSEADEFEDPSTKREVLTPEIYFGLERIENLSPSQKASETVKYYTMPAKLSLNQFALEGDWEFSSEHTRLAGQSGKIKLNFYSKDVHMVGKAGTSAAVEVWVDGVLEKTIEVSESKLYTLFEGQDSRSRIIELQISGQGFEIYTFTFG